MKPKYEFTGKTKVFEGITLHQIKRLSDGYVGGWIESEANLSHEGTCWVWDNAMVFGHALVSGNAKLFDKAIVRDYAIVTDNAKVCGCGVVRDRAVACGNASIGGIVSGSARVSGKASVGESFVIWQSSAVKHGYGTELYQVLHLLKVRLILFVVHRLLIPTSMQPFSFLIAKSKLMQSSTRHTLKVIT